MSITKSFPEHIKETFSKTDSRDFAKEYLEVLHSNWRIAYDKQNRSMVAFLFLALAFELLTRAAISEVSIGPFKLTDLSIIHKLLPALLGYFYFEVVEWGKWRSEISNVYLEVINSCYPSISENKLQYYLSADGINIFGYRYRKLKNKFFRHLQAIIRLPMSLFAVAGPFLIEVYAFYQLFNLFGWNDLLVWFSLVSSVLLLILAYTSMGELVR